MDGYFQYIAADRPFDSVLSTQNGILVLPPGWIWLNLTSTLITAAPLNWKFMSEHHFYVNPYNESPFDQYGRDAVIDCGLDVEYRGPFCNAHQGPADGANHAGPRCLSDGTSETSSKVSGHIPSSNMKQQHRGTCLHRLRWGAH